MTPEEATQRVKRRALELGFDSVGIAELGPPPHAKQLLDWLAQGFAGTMTYMHRQVARRANPETIVPGASCAIVVTRNHFGRDPEKPRGHGRVAKYARGRDYHDSLQEPLAELCAYVKSIASTDVIAKYYVDAGPVPERELAQRAGIGWIGKNTMLIDDKRGSFFFLASIFTNLPLAPDQPYEFDRCGSCRRCIDACPTSAFSHDRVLDSRLCISYLTIEHKGPIDAQVRARMGDWVFGCDVCQDVCPWNLKFASVGNDSSLKLNSSRAYEDLDYLCQIDDREFEERFGWTPLERPGPEGIRRNARIAASNTTSESPCQTSPTQ